MNSMSLKNKLILLVSVLLLFCAILGTIGYHSTAKVSDAYTQIEQETVPNLIALLEGLAQMRAARIYLVQLGMPNLTVAEIKDLRERIPKQLQMFEDEDKKYTAIPFGPEEGALYKPVKEQMEILKQDFTKAMELHEKSAGKEGTAMEEMRKLLEDKMMVDGKNYREALNKLIDYQNNEMKTNVATAHDAKSSGNTMIFSAIIGALFLGGLLAFIVLKNIMAEQLAAAKAMEEAVRSFNMVEKSTISTMMGSLDGNILYINEMAKTTLKKLEKYIPEKIENLIGAKFDFLHKNPSEQSLPSKTLISLGSDKLDLLISGIYDKQGKYIGPMMTFEVVTDKVMLVNDLTKAADDLAGAANNVLNISSNLSAAAEETSAQANTASVASEEVNAGVQTVATNMTEMVSAIKEITKTTNEASSMTNEAMRLAKNTNNIINKLGDSSMDIGNVIKVISSIAQQTNLLALNATIEAARAGEAGKGFAVVANEVKELANQTAKATHEITKKIETIQDDSKNAVNAIAEITIAIEKVNGFTGNIAASVEEQAATTNEVTRIVAESAEGVKQINENISQVSLAAANTGKDAGQAQVAAKGVGETAELLKKYVARLKV
jgi:methyl-accepting chemotaxis protein